MVLQCSDCKKSNFKTQQGLAVHQAKCKATKVDSLSWDCQNAAVADALRKKFQKKGLQAAPSLSLHIDLGVDASPLTEIDPAPVPDPEPEGSRSCSGHLHTFPSQYKDFLPMQAIPLVHAPQPAPYQPSGAVQAEQPCDSPGPLDDPQPPEPELTVFTTRVNDAGLFQVYPIKPTSDPDSIVGLEDVCKSPHFAVNTSQSVHNPLIANGILSQTQDQMFYVPFASPSIYWLMSWFFSGSPSKSLANLDRLVADVISAPDFNAHDFAGFSAMKEAKHLDEYQSSPVVSSNAASFSPSHSWTESKVPLLLPCERHDLVSKSKAPTFQVSGLFHQDIVDVVTTGFQDPEIFPTLHLMPYKEYWVLGEGKPPERVYGEMYTSDVFFDVWESVQDQCHIAEDALE